MRESFANLLQQCFFLQNIRFFEHQSADNCYSVRKKIAPILFWHSKIANIVVGIIGHRLLLLANVLFLHVSFVNNNKKFPSVGIKNNRLGGSMYPICSSLVVIWFSYQNSANTREKFIVLERY